MSNQSEWITILSSLKGAVMGFAKHGQDPEKIAQAVKNFAFFAEGNKGWLRNHPESCAVVQSFNNSLAADLTPPLLSLPHDQAIQRLEALMNAIDLAVAKISKDEEQKNSKIINNTINVTGSVSGNFQVGESNTYTENNSTQPHQKSKSLNRLTSNIGKIIVGIISAALMAWLGLK